MALTLIEIEKAIRSNFIIDKTPGAKFLNAVDDHYPNKPNIPLIVFIGLAYVNETKKNDVIDHLKITSAKYSEYISKFVTAYNTCFLFDIKKMYQEDNQNTLIYRKYTLLAKVLRGKQTKTVFLDLMDCLRSY